MRRTSWLLVWLVGIPMLPGCGVFAGSGDWEAAIVITVFTAISMLVVGAAIWNGIGIIECGNCKKLTTWVKYCAKCLSLAEQKNRLSKEGFKL